MEKETLYIGAGAVVLMLLVLFRGKSSGGHTVYSSGVTGAQAVALAQSAMSARIAQQNILANTAIAKDQIAASLKATSIKANLLAELEKMQSQTNLQEAQISANNSLSITKVQGAALEAMNKEAWTSKQAMLSGAEPSTGVTVAATAQKDILQGWSTFTHWFNLSGILGI